MGTPLALAAVRPPAQSGQSGQSGQATGGDGGLDGGKGGGRVWDGGLRGWGVLCHALGLEGEELNLEVELFWGLSCYQPPA